ncbi:MAG: orotidine-5'-phosphate decarboxylase [Christensenellaceae bacterium]|jgi:orotidine-5'-phosphate decarboxylase|nr:orotidine-5'-phosphate decarboxylase [Christensenellaceae bacterium]
MAKDVIIALDFSSKAETLNFLAQFEGLNPYIKIGMELFYSEGSSLVTELKEKGFKIFLDLKLHDIPNTVKKAMRNLARLGVDITNCHAGGGIEMMRAAKQGLDEGTGEDKKPLLIAVTQLTSTSETALHNELLINASMADTVKKYAENAKAAGLDGVVCSPLEAAIMKELSLISITPGVRPLGADVGDQQRVTTPAKARELGSTYIVVGRPITDAPNPKAAYLEIRKDFLGI